MSEALPFGNDGILSSYVLKLLISFCTEAIIDMRLGATEAPPAGGNFSPPDCAAEVETPSILIFL